MALRRGGLRWLDVGEACQDGERSVVAFERRCAAQTLRCAVNLGGEPRVLRQAAGPGGTVTDGELPDDRLGAFAAVVTS